MGKIESTGMTPKERERLEKLINATARAAVTQAVQRAAYLRTDTERQLSAQFQADDHEWADLTRIAGEAAAVADAELAKRCQALGIRESFRPHIRTQWSYRGENATRERRSELRALAVARIDEGLKQGKQTIEMWRCSALVRLHSGALQSAESQAFLATLPAPDALLPALTLAQLDVLASTPSLRLIPGEIDHSTGTDDY